MKNSYRTWLIGFILGICVFSLVLNTYLIHSKMTYTNQTQYAETYAMEHAIAEIKVANQYLITNKQYSLAMLAEAGGTLFTLQNIVHVNSENVRNHFYNVAYYLHSQASAASLNGLSQFINNAVQLLESHLVKGQYNLSYLSSDAIRLDQMIPKSGD